MSDWTTILFIIGGLLLVWVLYAMVKKTLALFQEKTWVKVFGHWVC